MNLNQLKLAGLLVLSLLLVAGCSSTPDKGEGDGAPVTEVDGAGASAGAGGAETAGASEGGAWTGSPLDDPNSLLSVRVIHFAFDSSEIQGQDREVIIAHGEYLAANPEVTVTIEGHTDERGSREYNIALGERRANAVKELMLVQGAAESQITTISYGEERPVALGSDEESWALNRRAELVY